MSGEAKSSSRSLKRNHSETMLSTADTATAEQDELVAESLATAAMAVAREIIDAHTAPLNPKIKPFNRFDDIYRYDKKQQQDILTAKPWEKDAHFFKEVKISALALLKMVTHSRSGGNLEVMGLVVGKTDGSTMIVLDSFALPVEGTETRVNAQSQAYEFMADYMDALKQVERHENVVGWYHSHPGYGCWLSGIDVSTQVLHQNFQEPFLAIVVDPTRTVSASKVCLGAFRTYPRGYKPPSEEPSEYQTIPLHKIEDFGVHCKQYYSLDVSYFKSRLDNKLLESLWNKYWVSNLSSSTLTTNSDYISSQIFDLSDKLEQSESNLGRCYSISTESDCIEMRRGEDKLMKATKDSNKTTMETLHGVMSQVLKDRLFNSSSIQQKPRLSNYQRKLLQRQQQHQQQQEL